MMSKFQKITEIICSLIKKGAIKPQVTMDFDMTLSTFSYKGKRCPTCHNSIAHCKMVTKECQESFCMLSKLILFLP
ncbi:hypothetical protein GH733_003067 [Mirounga leonina]|nr:hypothetical protein GH733_003067 [Mirounga leonina]